MLQPGIREKEGLVCLRYRGNHTFSSENKSNISGDFVELLRQYVPAANWSSGVHTPSVSRNKNPELLIEFTCVPGSTISN